MWRIIAAIVISGLLAALFVLSVILMKG